MEPIMKEYCELVGFLGKVLGQDYEIILHDLSNMDHSVIAVANGHVSGRRIGSPMNENGLRLIRSGAWKDNPEMIRYRGYSKKSNQLLCFARFIKNQEVWDEFAQTEAYSKLFMELATDAKAASAFVNGIVPAGSDAAAPAAAPALQG